jgi:hypothetical protein
VLDVSMFAGYGVRSRSRNAPIRLRVVTVGPPWTRSGMSCWNGLNAGSCFGDVAVDLGRLEDTTWAHWQ